ncbi:MAG: TonB-dependent receptor [Flammeovirgaceae bacterium]
MLRFKGNFKSAFVLFLFLFSIVQAFAQKGIVKGNVIDAKTAEELIGVSVLVEGTSTGTTTDLYGNYQLSLPVGTYNLVISYISYTSQKIQGVEVKEGEISQIDIKLAEETTMLQEVVVEAKAINNNDIAILKMQQKAFAVQDGITASEIKLTGASNSAESMKQVTGASLEGGRFIVMRGLGDRYTITQLNGITLPSTDPYRNSSSMDLIPSSMVDNIITVKTFTPDQPGNFTGGNVNITTKSLPEQFYLNFGTGIGFNTVSSLKDNFLTDPVKGKNDWLGYDDGSREMPTLLQNAANRALISGSPQGLEVNARDLSEQYNQLRNILNSTSKELASRGYIPTTKNTFLNTSYNLSLGNRKNLGGSTNFGYSIGLNYSRNYTIYENRELNAWEFSSVGAEALNNRQKLTGNVGIDNPNIGGIVSLALQTNPQNEISLNLIYNHDAEIEGASFPNGQLPAVISTPTHEFFSYKTSMMERTLSTAQLTGKHIFNGLNKAELQWIGSFTNASQLEPDVRLLAYDKRPNAEDDTKLSYNLIKADYELPFHFFRDLQDQQVNFNLDFTLPIGSNPNNKIKFGGLFSRKNREFEEFRYQLFEPRNGVYDEYLAFSEADGNLDAFFSPENTAVVGQNASRYIIGNIYSNQTLPQNSYEGFEQVIAFYTMGVYNFTEKLKVIGGARLEQTNFEVTVPQVDTLKGEINKLDVLPALHLVYAANDKTNIRVSASQTLARPNMREMAPFASFELLGGDIIQGNPNIKRTLVQNFDLRYEVFPKSGELLAASAFFKTFQDPIVRVIDVRAAGSSRQFNYDNSESGLLVGLELEFRKKLDFISPTLDKFKFASNFTYTYSKMKLTDIEYQSAKDFGIGKYRPFQAQSPFIWNVNLSYLNAEKDFESAIFMNMFGRRLYANGAAGTPDIYEIYGRNPNAIPTPDLGFTVSKGIGKHFNVKLTAQNLLNVENIRNHEYNNNYFITDAYRRGTTLNLSLKYSY